MTKRCGKGANAQKRLVIMIKVPKAGAVKTRLARDIGVVPATYFFRHAALRVIQRLSRDRRWQTYLAVTPDIELSSPAWPSEIPRIPQGGGNLGERMQRVFDRDGPGPVVIIGTDIPEISPAHIAHAFYLLGRHDVVFGPADDGGYWLVGQKRCPKVLPLFNGVRWSTEHTLADTRANLNDHCVALTHRLNDVDNAEEYRRLRILAARLVLPRERLFN